MFMHFKMDALVLPGELGFFFCVGVFKLLEGFIGDIAHTTNSVFGV